MLTSVRVANFLKIRTQALAPQGPRKGEEEHTRRQTHIELLTTFQLVSRKYVELAIPV